MICLVFLPSDLKNIIEVYNLTNNRKGGGKNVPGAGNVCALDWVDFSKAMQPGEKLYLLVHGDPMYVSTGAQFYTARKLAKKLIAAKLRPDVGSIKVVACNTGTHPADGSDPFCSVLSREIYGLSNGTINVRVTGVVGDEVVGKDGKIRGIVVATPEYDALVDDANWKSKVAAWENEVKQMKLATPQDIVDAAEEMMLKTQAFFEELYKANAKYIQDKNNSRFHSPANQ
ncbi:hypothetical protein SBA2_670050 [Acidobacteriia bacterium SbA2]|nr:hypothetical protein SBA2_670050 [Acidobacteriia bacterium SbA2]